MDAADLFIKTLLSTLSLTYTVQTVHILLVRSNNPDSG